jgi:hypothetical protein
VDLGIKTLAVVATSEGGTSEIAGPRHLSRALRKVRRLSRAVSRRQGPDHRTGRRPSNRWRRADAARNKALGKVAGQRRDAVRKLTTRLAATYGTVVIEDLNVAEEPQAGPACRGRLVRRAPPAAGVQGRLARRPGDRRGPLVRVRQDVPGMRSGESQAAPFRAGLRVRLVRHGREPRPERRAQPRRPGAAGTGREWPGQQRTWSRP